MTNSSFLKKLFLALSVVFLVSCDKDFNEVGADIIDDDIHHNITGDTIDVVAYDMPTGAVQSNNLFINQLGVYNSAAFGTRVSTYVTQLQFANNAENPKFSSAADIDTVYLYVPYFSKKIATDDAGKTTYKLDSIYGDITAKLKLNVYQNGYFLRDADPNATSGTQQYYSNDKAMVDVLKVGARLNTGPLSQNDEFVVSADEIIRETTIEKDGEDKTIVIERMAPGIYLELNKAIFQEKIANASGTGNLLNNNVFKNYFRGLYFNVEQVDNKSVMAIPQFAKGVVTIKYKDHPIKTNGEFDMNAEVVRKTLTLNMSGNSINFFENAYKGTFTDAITSSDAVNGDSRLYVKGGEGSMAVININQAAIEDLRTQNKTKGVLINEANLSFYIDKTAMTDSKEPLRIYLYDLKNKKPIYDYTTDISSNSVNSKYNKIVHGGIIEYGTDKRGTRYKIRLTNHINNLIKKDSLNVPLGLVVTEDIMLVSNASLRTPFTVGTVNVDKVPVSAVVNPLGTVLYGNNVPEEEKDKRLKLEIFYTKPN
ncbi:hypothetical protein D3C87_588780 [compost metagenome]